jgi:hypothetical protein
VQGYLPLLNANFSRIAEDVIMAIHEIPVGFIICQYCGSIFLRKNRRKHFLKTHATKSKQKMEEAKKILDAFHDQEKRRNPKIAKYLRENPISEEKKFGEPQDKYRYNFYGNRGMEYDTWRLGPK